MISGLSKAGQALGKSMFVDQAAKTASFLETHMYDKASSTLYRTSYVERDTVTTGQVYQDLMGQTFRPLYNELKTD